MRALTVLLFTLLSFSASARDLTNKELFFRCYQHLTQKYPAKNNPARIQVEVHGKDAVSACMEDVFDKALLVNNEIANPSDSIGVAVLNNFQNLHASWFAHKNLPAQSVGGYTSDFPVDIYETSLPANYISRSLFDQSIPFKYVLTAQHHLDTKRSLGPKPLEQTLVYQRDFIKNLADTYFNDFSMILETGQVVGFKPRVAQNEVIFPYSFESYVRFLGSVRTYSGAVPLKAHYGGGAIGSVPYILQSVDEDFTFEIDGGIEIPRKWGESIMSDFLCRELPAVREEDVLSYVNANAELPYRKQTNCTACHATMDQMSGLVRGFNTFEIRHYRYQGAPSTANDLRGGVTEFNLKYHPKDPRIGTAYNISSPFPPPEPALQVWPDYTDADYQKRPATGKLFYRDVNGVLVNEELANIDDLGLKLVSRIDPYVCAVKRYYEYFYGVSVPITDPINSSDLASDNVHKQKIMSHANSLAGSPIGSGEQSLRSLIFNLLNSDSYKKSDFGVVK